MLPPLEPYTLVLLVRGEDADTPLDDDLLDKLQEEHVAYIQALVERGKIIVCGPLAGCADPPSLSRIDPQLRGAAIFRTSIEEARQLVEGDPAVRAGRIAVRAMTWWVEKGQLASPEL